MKKTVQIYATGSHFPLKNNSGHYDVYLVYKEHKKKLWVIIAAQQPLIA